MHQCSGCWWPSAVQETKQNSSKRPEQKTGVETGAADSDFPAGQWATPQKLAGNEAQKQEKNALVFRVLLVFRRCKKSSNNSSKSAKLAD
ncbi:UNVERIFIED_CONTAM: hypothetical protein Sangu_2834400 [Sesamum angustifolium]|uniref:Uncharacterized protein n=1 Tax=Sesamum angustifolium TaxID=2727405 RepID=A0AAW2IQ75_9LAMI